MKKIHEWLSELNSHACYDHTALSKNFEEETGKKPTWHGYPVEVANQTVGTLKGLLNPIKGKGMVADGHNIAGSLAAAYAPMIKRRAFYGRGSNFWEAVKALKEANV